MNSFFRISTTILSYNFNVCIYLRSCVKSIQFAKVDTSLRFISSLYIVDANNGFTTTFLGFTVVVSNTSDHNDGVICFRDRTYSKYTVPPYIDIVCSVVGRFVIYYNERLPGIDYPNDYSTYAFSDLCEVEVYGNIVIGV